MSLKDLILVTSVCVVVLTLSIIGFMQIPKWEKPLYRTSNTTEFIHGDEVEVVEGFYKGCYGEAAHFDKARDMIEFHMFCGESHVGRRAAAQDILKLRTAAER